MIYNAFDMTLEYIIIKSNVRHHREGPHTVFIVLKLFF